MILLRTNFHPRHIKSLIHEMLRWMALDALNITKLPGHPIWKIRPHVRIAPDEAREKGLLGERSDTLWLS